jgi:hypothetical protein
MTKSVRHVKHGRQQSRTEIVRQPPENTSREIEIQIEFLKCCHSDSNMRQSFTGIRSEGFVFWAVIDQFVQRGRSSGCLRGVKCERL